MQMLRCVALAAALALLPGIAFSQGKTAPKDAKLYFITPHDGQKVRGGFWVRFGLRNMGVTHAGDEYQNAGQAKPQPWPPWRGKQLDEFNRTQDGEQRNGRKEERKPWVEPFVEQQHSGRETGQDCADDQSSPQHEDLVECG